MKVLILTGKFGLGHYSVAEALKQELESNIVDLDIKVVDILDYLIPTASKFIYESFNMLVTKWSNLYNFINSNNEESNIKTVNFLFINKIEKLIDEYKPDEIISTLPISSKYISQYKSIKKSNIPLITVITDISSHNEWLYKNTDFYFIGDESIKKSLIKKGIKESKIIITGIPVKQSFKNNISDCKSRKQKEILIMGGGLGLISINEDIFKVLNEEKSISTTVITGNNKKAYDYIKDKYNHIKVIGYTDKISEYMNKADLIISKPGGITLFEALYSEVPIYVIKPFLLQEVKNAKYIEEKNIGRIIWNDDLDIGVNILDLINDNEAISEMKNNMREIKRNIDQDEIINVINRIKRGA